MARARLSWLTSQYSDVVSMVVSDCVCADSGLPPKKQEDFELELDFKPQLLSRLAFPADAIIKMARAKLLQFTSISSGGASVLISDDVYADLGLSYDQHKDFEPALLLQAAAVNFSNEKFDSACNSLGICVQSAFLTGNPLQRVAYFFATALQERITREVGTMVHSEALAGNQRKQTVDEAFTSLQPAVIECQYELPFCQISQFAAIQAIMDNVASAKRVHLVDPGIKTGSYWPVMMQALADRYDCPLELLKITAVGPSKQIIEEVVVSEIRYLEADFFELEADEVLAVHSRLSKGISKRHIVRFGILIA
ncbi:GRAS family protein RAM1-like [Coffea arabica]|uniref:GRAS family protein RAM1-like n=1 Tax=Coffea arabica TaxID=13443 RepID=A0A6P6X4R4_COFAR|nr:DELLA protein RGL1-like [Coffea arabica]